MKGFGYSAEELSWAAIAALMDDYGLAFDIKKADIVDILNKLRRDREKESDRWWWRDRVSYDALAEGRELDEPAWLSDEGASVGSMETVIDWRGVRFRAVRSAERYVQRNAGDLLDVMRLVLKNGDNRKESIWEIMKMSKEQ